MDKALELLRRWAVMGDLGHPLLSQEMVELRKETKEFVREHSDDSS